jgi:hypothetical protein
MISELKSSLKKERGNKLGWKKEKEKRTWRG